MICQKCLKHEGTENWVGGGGTLDYIHGNYQMWCECCCLKAQLKNAKEAAKRVIPLERKLLKLKCT